MPFSPVRWREGHAQVWFLGRVCDQCHSESASDATTRFEAHIGKDDRNSPDTRGAPQTKETS